MLIRLLASVLAVLFATGCAESPSPTGDAPTSRSTGAAELRIRATGLVRQEVIPDFVTSYSVRLTDPDGHVYEGFFDDPRTGPTPPGSTLLGDVPSRVGPGHYGIEFSMERVSDISSFVPVPSSTPFLTNRELMTSCQTAFDARPDVDLDITGRWELEVPDGGAPTGSCTIGITPVANPS